MITQRIKVEKDGNGHPTGNFVKDDGSLFTAWGHTYTGVENAILDDTNWSQKLYAGGSKTTTDGQTVSANKVAKIIKVKQTRVGTTNTYNLELTTDGPHNFVANDNIIISKINPAWENNGILGTPIFAISAFTTNTITISGVWSTVPTSNFPTNGVTYPVNGIVGYFPTFSDGATNGNGCVETDLAVLNNAGSNIIRVSLQLNKWLTNQYTIKSSDYLTRLRLFLNLAAQYDIYVILNASNTWAPGEQPDWLTWSSEESRWTAQATLWERIVKIVKSNPAVAWYSLISEPTDFNLGEEIITNISLGDPYNEYIVTNTINLNNNSYLPFNKYISDSGYGFNNSSGIFTVSKFTKQTNIFSTTQFGTITSNSTILNVANSSGMMAGQYIYGKGIELGTKIQSINGNQLTLTRKATVLTNASITVATETEVDAVVIRKSIWKQQSYSTNDVVYYNNNYYIANQSTSAIPDDTAYWTPGRWRTEFIYYPRVNAASTQKLTNQKNWDNTKNYVVNDFVTYNKISYIAISNTTPSDIPGVSNNWAESDSTFIGGVDAGVPHTFLRYGDNPNITLVGGLPQADPKLGAAITSTTQTTIQLNSTANLPPTGVVTINTENIYYQGINGNNLINCIRGYKDAILGTSSPAAHIINTTVNLQTITLNTTQGIATGSTKFVGGNITIGSETISYIACNPSRNWLYFISRSSTHSNGSSVLLSYLNYGETIDNLYYAYISPILNAPAYTSSGSFINTYLMHWTGTPDSSGNTFNPHITISPRRSDNNAIAKMWIDKMYNIIRSIDIFTPITLGYVISVTSQTSFEPDNTCEYFDLFSPHAYPVTNYSNMRSRENEFASIKYSSNSLIANKPIFLEEGGGYVNSASVTQRETINYLIKLKPYISGGLSVFYPVFKKTNDFSWYSENDSFVKGSSTSTSGRHFTFDVINKFINDAPSNDSKQSITNYGGDNDPPNLARRRTGRRYLIPLRTSSSVYDSLKPINSVSDSLFYDFDGADASFVSQINLDALNAVTGDGIAAGGTLTSDSNTITNYATISTSTTTGSLVTGNGIADNTIITSINGTNITLNNPVLSSSNQSNITTKLDGFESISVTSGQTGSFGSTLLFDYTVSNRSGVAINNIITVRGAINSNFNGTFKVFNVFTDYFGTQRIQVSTYNYETNSNASNTPNSTTFTNGRIYFTTLNVLDTSKFTDTGTIQIDSEQITYTGKTDTSFTGCTRGTNSTTIASHNNKSIVNAYIQNNVKLEIANINNYSRNYVDSPNTDTSIFTLNQSYTNPSNSTIKTSQIHLSQNQAIDSVKLINYYNKNATKYSTNVTSGSYILFGSTSLYDYVISTPAANVGITSSSQTSTTGFVRITGAAKSQYNGIFKVYNTYTDGSGQNHLQVYSNYNYETGVSVTSDPGTSTFTNGKVKLSYVVDAAGQIGRFNLLKKTPAVTTLKTACNATATSIELNSVTGLSSSNPGYLYISDELIRYSAITPGTTILTGVTRGLGDTTAIAHIINPEEFIYKTSSFIENNTTTYPTLPSSTDLTLYGAQSNKTVDADNNSIYARWNIQVPTTVSRNKVAKATVFVYINTDWQQKTNISLSRLATNGTSQTLTSLANYRGHFNTNATNSYTNGYQNGDLVYYKTGSTNVIDGPNVEAIWRCNYYYPEVTGFPFNTQTGQNPDYGRTNSAIKSVTSAASATDSYTIIVNDANTILPNGVTSQTDEQYVMGGVAIVGTGIPDNTKIVSINTSTNVLTLSKRVTIANGISLKTFTSYWDKIYETKGDATTKYAWLKLNIGYEDRLINVNKLFGNHDTVPLDFDRITTAESIDLSKLQITVTNSDTLATHDGINYPTNGYTTINRIYATGVTTGGNENAANTNIGNILMYNNSVYNPSVITDGTDQGLVNIITTTISSEKTWSFSKAIADLNFNVYTNPILQRDISQEILDSLQIKFTPNANAQYTLSHDPDNLRVDTAYVEAKISEYLYPAPNPIGTIV